MLLPTLLDRRLRAVAVVLLVAAGGEAAAFEHDLFVDWRGRALAAFDSGDLDAIQRAHDQAAGHLVHLSTSLDQPYIQALFVLRPDPRDYLRRGLAAVGVQLTAPARMGDDAQAGDLLVLGPGDQPPAGAQPLFDEAATVGSPVFTLAGPGSSSVVLVQVYRR
jgi:hypothetical protein